MTTTEVIRPYCVVLNGTYTLVNLADNRVDPGFGEFERMAANATAPTFLGVLNASPLFALTTEQIKEVLAVTTNGIFADLSSSNDAIFKWRYAQSAGVGFGSNGVTATITDSAFLYWSSLEARQDSVANMSLAIEPIYNGTNAPLVLAADEAVTSAATDAYLYTLGPVTVGAVDIEPESVRLDVQPNVDRRRSGGDVWNTWIGIQSTRPVITVTSANSDLMVTAGDWPASSGTLTWYLRRLGTGGTTYADEATEHIKIVATGAQLLGDSLSGGQTTARFRLYGLPTITTGQAIT